MGDLLSGKGNDNLLPRRYQEEVFCRAQEGNIIAALDTGSGKTFISTLLIKYISSVQFTPRKVIIFLVPKVTLVEQQGDFIANQTPIRVCKLHGMLDIDLTDRSGWRQRFLAHDVFVMTAQIFLNLLTHSLWSIDKVSLMIFDECHHARKNHPYNGIMREYFQCHPNARPKVFGMTASPIWNPKDAKGSLDTLEQNLDAKVVGVREHVEELAVHSTKPTELIKEYPPPPVKYSYSSPTLLDCLEVFYDAWQDADVPWTNIRSRYYVTLNNLGPYCAELYLHSEITHRVIQLLNAVQSADPASQTLEVADSEISLKCVTNLIPDILQIQSILSEFSPFFECTPSLLNPVSPTWFSPKVSVLVEILQCQPPTFQGIIFVEQRQTALCLVKILPCILQLEGFLRCAELVGQGATDNGTAVSMGFKSQQKVVKAFREGVVNLLVATSVAEEGLDFPACDIVVRFDELQHMVGYVQSRGRARNKASTFVIMVEQDHSAHLARYNSFMEKEPELRRAYQTRETHTEVDGEEIDEDEDPIDVSERERYVIPSTGAVLTYDTSINLLNYLCSSMVHDLYSPSVAPRYSGDFSATLQLPPTLPIPRSLLVHTGPLKRSKKEARRAVAFLAVRNLHRLKVFDDYLLPISKSAGCDTEDANGSSMWDVQMVPVMMDVLVRDPWAVAGKMWVHPVYLDGSRTAAVITGTMLPAVELMCDGVQIRMESGDQLNWDEDGEHGQCKLLDAFTKLGISYCNTGRPITSPLTCFLAPLSDGGEPDFRAMKVLVDDPHGSYDWSSISEDDYGHLMIVNSNEIGRPLVLRRVRHDLTPMSAPLPGSLEDGFLTYREYFQQKYAQKKRGPPRIPADTPLVEAYRLPRLAEGAYQLKPPHTNVKHSVPVGLLVPQGCCRWIDLAHDVYRTFHVLPQLCHRITDVYRARQARLQLSLPAINDDLLVEALTLPTAVAGWNNQRLETLGDSFLKLGTTVHLYNKFPHRHEGQLAIIRQNNICNRTLLSLAKEIGLERFLSCETSNLSMWRYTIQEQSGSCPIRYARREFPRRNLQDCMESTLGAAFVTGGILMALQTGEALGIDMGGSVPWSLRYSRDPEPTIIPPFFTELQEALGYEFHRSELLVEAITHPSFAASVGSSSYQRLEFLGDAVIDLAVLQYLFDKFPNSTSDQLSWPKTRVVSSPAFAALAVQQLSIHKFILTSSIDLTIAISQYVPLLQNATPDEIVNQNWKWDPPKAISDVFEAIMGAVLVDSAYNYERAAGVVEFVMKDVLAILSPCLRRDPVTELMVWIAKNGCRKMVFQKIEPDLERQWKHGYVVKVHDVIIARPIRHASLPVAKNLVADEALPLLRDENSEGSLRCLCDCGESRVNSKKMGGKHDVLSALRDATNLDPTPSRAMALKPEDDIQEVSNAARVCTLNDEQEVFEMLVDSGTRVSA